MRAGEVWGGDSGTGFVEMGKSRWRCIGILSVTDPGRTFWST